MSCNYADGLSPYHDKGQLGLEERFDSKSVVTAKVSLLAKWINEAKHVVVHTGAGISTSAGIPDFRGPRGVWTLQAKGEKPDLSTDFNEAIPTPTHMAITKLVERDKVKYVISQNIDGLHLRSNLQRKFLSELHGNMFIEQCNACNRQYVRCSAVPTVGQKSLNKPCPGLKANGRPCRGRLHDTILDWEHNLPENDLGMADYHSCMADLSICLGTTMQIVPSGNLPLYTKKHGGKLVICNLQPTKHDRKADLLIHAYVDEVMAMLMKNLSLKIPKYSVKNDPTKTVSLTPEKYIEWTISDSALKKMKKIYEEKCGTKEAKKRLEMIDDDLPLSIKANLKRNRHKDEDDSDLEVLDVIVNKAKKVKEQSKRAAKKNSTTPAADNNENEKKVAVKKREKSPPPPKKPKYEGEKITIKKNVTPTKTKYEIVQPKPKKPVKCEIVYNDSDVCNDLDMICESDDDDVNNFTYNFKLYLRDEKPVKKEEPEEAESVKKEESEVKKEEGEVKKEESEVKEGTETAEEKEIKAEDENKKDDERESAKENAVESVNTAEDKDKENANENKLEDENQNTQNETENEAPPSDDKTEADDKTEEDDKTVKCKADDSSENESQSKETPIENEVEKGKKDEEKKNGAEEVQTEKPKTAEDTNVESELAKFIENAAEKEGLQDLNNQPVIDKSTEKNSYSNMEADMNLGNSNIENSIEQFVNQPNIDNSLAMPECNMNNSLNENYSFYNNDYNSTNNQTELDYVSNNYYSNF